MTRAGAAVGVGGVLFHGMAGAGKTACALELAYTHQDSFQLLAWPAGPSAPLRRTPWLARPDGDAGVSDGRSPVITASAGKGR